jgi:hypothetical protein
MSRLATLAFVYAACHGATSNDSPDGGAPQPDGAGAPTMDTRIAAAKTVATTDPRCAAIAPFYWQIGDAHAAITDGSVPSSTSTTVYQADSRMDIASATKLVFGAYVVERYRADLGAIDHRAMTLQSGYVSLSYTSCVPSKTVDDCLAAGNSSPPPSARRSGPTSASASRRRSWPPACGPRPTTTRGSCARS